MIINDATPIFIQIKERIKDDIMSGVYEVDELIISTTQISKLYSVNPATAVKSVGLLQDEGIVYKKRGIGIGVTALTSCQRANRFLWERINPQMALLSNFQVGNILTKDFHFSFLSSCCRGSYGGLINRLCNTLLRQLQVDENNRQSRDWLPILFYSEKAGS